MKYMEGFLSVVFLGTVVLYGLLGLARGQKGYTICDVQGCNCTVVVGGWRNVNCNLLDDQELTLSSEHIPKEVAEIYLIGGQSITFTTKTFNQLKALDLLRLEKVKNIVIEHSAFFQIQSTSLLVQIFGCDDLVFRSQAFEDMQGSLLTEVIGAKRVKLEESPFSKLNSCIFQSIQHLALETGAFQVRNIGSIGRHGPITVVSFIDVEISDIIQGVFRTSLAQISFRDSRVGRIRSEAFTSAEISSVQMINTTFDVIMTKAFTETLVIDFRISNCEIKKLQAEAIMAGMSNLTVNHSTITDIETRAIASTVAKVEIVGNQILTFHPTAISINNWNRITMDQNLIKNLHSDFIIAPWNRDIELFSFKGNEIYNAMEGSLSFLSKLYDARNKLVFDDNFFKQPCSCHLTDWVESLINGTNGNDLVMDTSFCTVDEHLSKCFSLSVGIINMQNFTERTCMNNTTCEPYNGETRTINTTGKMFVDHEQSDKQNWLILIIVIIAFFILALVGTFVTLLIRGSRWLKRKGYFRNNYYNNNPSNEEEENTIVTIDTENEKLEIPEELTMDFLQQLSKRLDDPATHQEASEMIERLYEMFIVDDTYENNNREEEAHLYEELGNLNLQIPPPPYEEQAAPVQSAQAAANQNTGPKAILKLMEEKFSINGGPMDNIRSDLELNSSSSKPILTGDYSEPIDRDVHLYSELRQKDENKKDSVKSNNSNSLAMRPLPDKPEYRFKAGPSSQL